MPPELVAPLAGWVVLERRPAAAHLAPVPPAERVRVLSEQSGLGMSGEHLLDLAELPMWALTRSDPAMDADAVLAVLR